jgi:hypothetical protein
VRLASGEERTVEYATIDKARTVVDWSPKPKPGKGGGRVKASPSALDDRVAELADDRLDHRVDGHVDDHTASGAAAATAGTKEEKHPS